MIPKLVHDYPKTGAWRSQNWCLTVLKLASDDRQAQFLGLHLRSQIWCLMMSGGRLRAFVGRLLANCMLKLYWTAQIQFSSGHQLICTYLYSQLSGIIFGISETISEMVPEYRQAPFLPTSCTSFGIVRHQFWDCQAPVLGSNVFFWSYMKNKHFSEKKR